MRGDFQLGQWLVQPQLNLLSGPEQSVHIEPKVMQVLVFLAGRAGDVISKKDLKKQVWEDTYVTDDVLTRSISELRKALGDDPKNPEVIQTIPRGGYRLIASVTPVSEEEGRSQQAMSPAPAPALGAEAVEVARPVVPPSAALAVGTARTRVRLAWVLPILAVAGLVLLAWWLWTSRHEGPRFRSIAVLPLKNLSEDPEQKYFADSMTEALIADLATIGPLQVTSRTSIMRYQGTTKPAGEIARELRVDALLEGSVLRVGNRVRITAQLIDGSSDTHIWSASYEREFRDILFLQKEVARAVAQEVRVTLSPREEQRLSQAASVKPEVYQAYLRGRYFWNQRTKEAFEKAVEYFEAASAADPNFSLAYAGLADTYNLLAHYGFHPHAETYAKARKAAQRALEIDESSAEAHASLALIAMSVDRDWATAERGFRRAIELRPNYATAHHWLALCLIATRQTEEAIKEAQIAKQLDPISLATNTFLAQCFLLARQFDRAAQQASETVDLYPDSPSPRVILAESLWRQGKIREAVAQIERVKKSWPDDPAKIEATAMVIAGQKQQAVKGVQDYVRANNGDCPDPVFCAETFALTGQKDEALRWLEKAFQQGDSNLLIIGVDPTYDQLRNDSRFVELLRRLGL